MASASSWPGSQSRSTWGRATVYKVGRTDHELGGLLPTRRSTMSDGPLRPGPLNGPVGAVHVLGSLNVDHTVRVTRHPAVGETVSGAVRPATPGGKGLNQAVAAARAGRSAEIEVRLHGRVGDD